jgi:CubicO group peptidase (beta-lactamase class C family)
MKHLRTHLLVVCSFVIAQPFAAADGPVVMRRSATQNADARVPGRTWRQYATPEEAGWSSEKLAKAREYYDSIDSAAAVVVHDGAVLAAWGDIDRRFMCHSVRKSLLSALYGVHVAAGAIDLNKTMADLKIDDVPPLTPLETRARIVDLIRSRSAVYHPAAYETAGMKEKRPKRGSHQPGEHFWYNNWDFNTLCTIFEQETEARVFEEFQKQFAIPLQMEDYRLQDTYYHLESEHSIHPAYPFRLSARDMARFGLLFLRKGQWGDQRILTEQWVKVSTSSHFREGDTTPNPQYAYGYLWWRIIDGPFKHLGMFSARGYGGHAIDVLPAANLVFVHRVDTFWDLAAPLGREKRRVADSERFELLELILAAREREPEPNPRLKPLASVRNRRDIVKPVTSTLARYARTYDFGDFALDIKLAATGLLIGNAGTGDFSLLPRSETQFIVEDLEAPVRFELDDDGNPVRVIAEFAAGKRTAGQPVP